jgi:hypothetical protein
MQRNILIALLLLLPLKALCADFKCPEGVKSVVKSDDGIRSYRCILEKEPNHYVQVGPVLFLKNGKPFIEGYLDYNNEPHGMWRSWDDAGVLTSEGRFKHGRRVGVWLEKGGDGTDIRNDYGNNSK